MFVSINYLFDFPHPAQQLIRKNEQHGKSIFVPTEGNRIREKKGIKNIENAHVYRASTDKRILAYP